MSMRSRLSRLGAMLAGLAIVAATTMSSALAHSSQSANAQLDHVFVIMLENHSYSSVIGDPNAPFINSLATDYGLATSYYGVTHPSLPNYVAAISGSNWSINNDNPANRFDHTNLVDQLEASHHSWAAYMEAMPADDKTVDNWPANSTALYASKHNPFVLFNDIRNNPARMASVKPFSDFAGDLASNRVADFVWISPDQCNDMHGGVYSAVDGYPETPCPYGSANNDANDAALKQKADAFVQRTVTAIMGSSAWTGNSAIFIVTDENDFAGANTSIDQWASADGCCDSPILPDGYQFVGSHGTYDGNVLDCPDGALSCVYGGGLIPAVVVARNGVRNYVSDQPYNHYSLLRTIEENWNLGYLGNASDGAQVQSMREFLVH
jgi:hypothetical protein